MQDIHTKTKKVLTRGVVLIIVSARIFVRVTVLPVNLKTVKTAMYGIVIVIIVVSSYVIIIIIIIIITIINNIAPYCIVVVVTGV